MQHKNKKRKPRRSEQPKQKKESFIDLRLWEQALGEDEKETSIFKYFTKYFDKPKNLLQAIQNFNKPNLHPQLFSCCCETLKILTDSENLEYYFFIKQIFKSEKFKEIAKEQFQTLESNLQGRRVREHQNFEKKIENINNIISVADKLKESIKFEGILECLKIYFNSRDVFSQYNFNFHYQDLNSLIETYSDSQVNQKEKSENQTFQEQQIEEYYQKMGKFNVIVQGSQTNYKYQEELCNSRAQSSRSIQTSIKSVSIQSQQIKNSSQIQITSQSQQTFVQSNKSSKIIQEQTKLREPIKYKAPNVFSQPRLIQNSRLRQYTFIENITYRQCQAEPSVNELRQLNEENAHLVYGGEIVQLQNLSYYSTQLFLNNHFFILREDFMLGFRKAIARLKSNNFSQIDSTIKENVFVFKDIFFQGVEATNKGLIYKVGMMVFEYETRQIDLKRSKRLQNGSLLVITNEDWEYILFCKTMSDPKITKSNIILIEITIIDMSSESQINYINALLSSGKKLFAIQNKVLFESYVFFLKRLKCKELQNMPFRDFIVNNSKNQIPPTDYLLNQRNEIIQLFREFGTTLDSSQFKAVVQIVTNSIALIQGPPGTGKTYCGALGVKMMLKLRKLKQNKEMEILINSKIRTFENQMPRERPPPILIICQTNHALDQFLTHILEFCPRQSIVRLGARSKVTAFEDLTLMSYQKQRKLKFDWQEFYKLKQQLTQNLKEQFVFSDVSFHDISHYSPQILQKIVSDFFKILKKKFIQGILLQSKKLIIESWLNEDRPKQQLLDDIKKIEQRQMNRLIQIDEDDYFEIDVRTFQSSQGNESSNSDNEQVEESSDDSQYIRQDYEKDSQSDDEDDDQIVYEDNAAIEFEQYRKVQKHQSFEKSATNPQDVLWRIKNQDFQIWNISQEERYILYNFIKHKKKYHNEDENENEIILEKFDQNLFEIKQISDYQDIQHIKSKQIVAATITGCAKNSDLLTKIKFNTLIVEEAGEVLESHIIANLFESINHLILIGDHQQLQPHLQCYELEQNYQANISLFERLIKNGLGFVSLEFQRRMKSKFADFIRLIYENYQDHEDIQKRNLEKLDCLQNDLIFFNHNYLEKDDSQSKSKSNIFEAEMIVQLIEYLIKNKIKNSQITILTTYKRQAQIIKNKLKQKIHVSTVDDYQGDENDIIILSLVRSNNNNSLGYVAIDNRVCVAFSRAKLALIVFGNFEFIEESIQAKLQKYKKRGLTSDLWLKIIDLAKEKKVIHNCLDLSCPIHQKITKIEKLTDWKKVELGGCQEICKQKFPCGHICKKPCHKNEHLRSDCQEIVEKQLPCGHLQTAKCGSNETSCLAVIEKKLYCGHTVQLYCHQKNNQIQCKNKCDRLLECNHKCQGLCYQNCYELKCLETIQIRLKCKHEKKIICFEKYELSKVICEEPCQIKLDCGHQCIGHCGVCLPDLHYPCYQQHEEILECDHKTIRTSNECSRCNNECDYFCNCQQKCQLKCDQQCIKCLNNCKLRCAHSLCVKKCSEICLREPCNLRCKKTLTCGCQCMGLCGETCPQVCLDKNHQNLHITKQLLLYQLECKKHCLFRVPFLDSYMENQSTDSLIKCNHCNSIIWSSSRYQAKVKQAVHSFNEKKLQKLNEYEITPDRLEQIVKLVKQKKEFLKENNLKDNNSFLNNIQTLINNELKKKDNPSIRYKQVKTIEMQLLFYKKTRRIISAETNNFEYQSLATILTKYYMLNEEFQENYSKAFWEKLQIKILNLYKYQVLAMNDDLGYRLQEKMWKDKILNSNFSLSESELKEMKQQQDYYC